MNKDQAETIALNALQWILGNDELRPVFMGSSGADENALHDMVKASENFLAVLDFLVMDDAWVIQFCDEFGLDYMTPMQARQALPGGGETNWT